MHIIISCDTTYQSILWACIKEKTALGSNKDILTNFNSFKRIIYQGLFSAELAKDILRSCSYEWRRQNPGDLKNRVPEGGA